MCTGEVEFLESVVAALSSSLRGAIFGGIEHGSHKAKLRG